MDTKNENFEKLPLKERIIITTSGQLIRYIRGHEDAKILSKEDASKLIGSVKKLTAIARGEEPVEHKPGDKMVIN